MMYFLMQQKIKNPNYKGKWKTPWIDNPGMEFAKIILEHWSGNGLLISGLFSSPEFVDDPDLYVLKPIKYVGIEVWQVWQKYKLHEFCGVWFF